MKKSVFFFDQITIIGGGLIGVSLAKIARKNKLVNLIIVQFIYSILLFN